VGRRYCRYRCPRQSRENVFQSGGCGDVAGIEEVSVTVDQFNCSPPVPIHDFADACVLLQQRGGGIMPKIVQPHPGDPAELHTSWNFRATVYGL
jgi:hypothetical protein